MIISGINSIKSLSNRLFYLTNNIILDIADQGGKKKITRFHNFIHKIININKIVPPLELQYTVGDNTSIKQARDFFPEFIKYTSLKKNDRVLDVGCGIGLVALTLLKYLAHGKYEGFSL